MSDNTQERYNAVGLLAQMRRILDDHDEERRHTGDVNIYVGVMLYTLEKLWDVVGHSDLTTGSYQTRYQARACAAVVGDLCRQPDWGNAKGPTEWDTYYDTIQTLHWLLQATHEEWCPVTDKIGNTCTCLAGREI